MFADEKMDEFYKSVQSGSLQDLFKIIYANDLGSKKLLDLALMRLTQKQDECKDLEIKVYELLRHRANVDTCDLDNRSPLYYATIKGNSSLIDLLINYGNASIKTIDTDGNTILHTVASSTTSDPLSLSLLLVKVYSDAPELFEIRNHKRRRFDELFKTREQVLVFNRLKELKGMKSEPRQKNRNSATSTRMLIASMVIEGFKNISRLKGIKDVGNNVPISLSTKFKKKFDSCEYLKRYGGVDPGTQLIIRTSKDFSSMGNLVDQLKNGNPFNLFNYACAMLSKESVLEMLKTMQPRLKRGDFLHSTFDPLESLKFFHPDLLVSFLQQLDNEEICSICKEADSVRGQQWTTLSCKHPFHTSCIKEWFKMSWERTCPMCRQICYT